MARISLFNNPLLPNNKQASGGNGFSWGPTGGFLPPQGFYDPSKESLAPNVGVILDFLNNGGASGGQGQGGLTPTSSPSSTSSTSPMAAETSGSNWPDRPSFRPGYQQDPDDAFSFGDSIGNSAGILEWLSGGLGITEQSMDILSQILSGKYPSGLEQFPTGLSDQLLGAMDSVSSNWMERGRQLSKDMTKDIWGTMKGEVVDPLTESMSNMARDQLHTQTQELLRHGKRQIEDSTSGGARAQGMIDLPGEAIKAVGQGLQEVLPKIAQSGFQVAGSVLPGLSQQLSQLVEFSPQLNIARMYPDIIGNYMNTVRPNMLGAALTEGSNLPWKFINALLGIGSARNQRKGINEAGGGGGGGLFGSLF